MSRILRTKRPPPLYESRTGAGAFQRGRAGGHGLSVSSGDQEGCSSSICRKPSVRAAIWY